MRTITVKGTGTVSAKPDLIEISFRLEAADNDYDKAMKLASCQLNAVSKAVEQIGFEKGSLRTTDFNVSARRRNVRDRDGNFTSVFDGYACVHSMKLAFDFDSALLSRTLSVISATIADPNLSVRFTVKDPNAISEELLKSAAANAREKAEILCSASGVKLGELMTIDYNWGEVNVYSNTHYDIEEDCMPPMCSPVCFDAGITPDDIKVKDTATFVWEIK